MRVSVLASSDLGGAVKVNIIARQPICPTLVSFRILGKHMLDNRGPLFQASYLIADRESSVEIP